MDQACRGWPSVRGAPVPHGMARSDPRPRRAGSLASLPNASTRVFTGSPRRRFVKTSDFMSNLCLRLCFQDDWKKIVFLFNYEIVLLY